MTGQQNFNNFSALLRLHGSQNLDRQGQANKTKTIVQQCYDFMGHKLQPDNDMQTKPKQIFSNDTTLSVTNLILTTTG